MSLRAILFEILGAEGEISPTPPQTFFFANPSPHIFQCHMFSVMYRQNITTAVHIFVCNQGALASFPADMVYQPGKVRLTCLIWAVRH